MWRSSECHPHTHSTRHKDNRRSEQGMTRGFFLSESKEETGWGGEGVGPEKKKKKWSLGRRKDTRLQRDERNSEEKLHDSGVDERGERQ